MLLDDRKEHTKPDGKKVKMRYTDRDLIEYHFSTLTDILSNAEDRGVVIDSLLRKPSELKRL
ncbi:hypothetical protein SB768_08065 [Burkholderia sp. SIMBA_043]|nr:hypothetical protein [Burkholderia vietnamiensis]AJY05064.1 hypothetical protein AK36_2037 [Burkholderia vietnamiensis LMG 10929]